MAGPKLRGATDSALPTMTDHANDQHPVGASAPPTEDWNTKRLREGKPFQDKMVPTSGATKLGNQMGQMGAMVGGIGKGFNTIIDSLKRKP